MAGSLCTIFTDCMRSIINIAILLIIVSPCRAQDEVVPDTLDWRGYYPLEVGNVWEWRTEILYGYTGFDVREIISDTLLEGVQYFVQMEQRESYDANSGTEFKSRDTLLLRYDLENARVLSRQVSGSTEWDYTCDLGAAFGATISCEYSGDTWVYGGYAADGAEIYVGSDAVEYAAEKILVTLGGGPSYYHGVGQLRDIGEGNMGGTYFTYLKLGNLEYGERAVGVSSERARRTAGATKVRVYPNPVREHAFVVVASEHRISSLLVANVLGRILPVQSTCRLNECILNTASLSTGAYFVLLRFQNDETTTSTFVVVR